MADATADNMRQRVTIGAVWMIAWRVATRLLGLGSTMVLARLLVPADFGLVAMATTFSAALDSLTAIGLQDALIRRSENDPDLYATAFSMQLLRGIVTAAFVALAAWPVSRWFAEPRLLPVLLVLALGSLVAGSENIAVIEFRRHMRFDVEFRLLALPRLLQVVLTIGLAVTLDSYWALVFGIAAGKLFRVGMTYLVHPYRPHITLRRWRELVGFSFWTWMSGLASVAWERADPFVIGPALGPSRLGLYLLSAETAVLPMSELVAPALAALFAGIARLQHQGVNTLAMVMPITAMLLLMTVPLSIGMSATAGYAVAALLGDKWHEAVPLIAIFAPSCLVSPFSFVGATVLIARGLVWRNFQAVGISVVIKIAVFCAALQMTQKPEHLAMVADLTTVTEAMSYLIQLAGAGMTGFRAAGSSLARIAASGAVLASALYFSGLGWAPIAASGFAALLIGVAIGCGGIGIFTAAQLGLWALAGRPDGPERQLIHIARPFVASLRAKLPMQLSRSSA